MKRGSIQGSFKKKTQRYEAELNPVQTEPPDRRGTAAEKLCQALLKSRQRTGEQWRLQVVGDRSRLVPSKQHREVPGEELGQNEHQGREGLRVLCFLAGPGSGPAPGILEEPCADRVSPVATKDTLQLLLAEKTKLGQEVS